MKKILLLVISLHSAFSLDSMEFEARKCGCIYWTGVLNTAANLQISSRGAGNVMQKLAGTLATLEFQKDEYLLQQYYDALTRLMLCIPYGIRFLGCKNDDDFDTITNHSAVSTGSISGLSKNAGVFYRMYAQAVYNELIKKTDQNTKTKDKIYEQIFEAGRQSAVYELVDAVSKKGVFKYKDDKKADRHARFLMHKNFTKNLDIKEEDFPLISEMMNTQNRRTWSYKVIFDTDIKSDIDNRFEQAASFQTDGRGILLSYFANEVFSPLAEMKNNLKRKIATITLTDSLLQAMKIQDKQLEADDIVDILLERLNKIRLSLKISDDKISHLEDFTCIENDSVYKLTEYADHKALLRSELLIFAYNFLRNISPTTLHSPEEFWTWLESADLQHTDKALKEIILALKASVQDMGILWVDDNAESTDIEYSESIAESLSDYVVKTLFMKNANNGVKTRNMRDEVNIVLNKNDNNITSNNAKVASMSSVETKVHVPAINESSDAASNKPQQSSGYGIMSMVSNFLTKFKWGR